MQHWLVYPWEKMQIYWNIRYCENQWMKVWESGLVCILTRLWRMPIHRLSYRILEKAYPSSPGASMSSSSRSMIPLLSSSIAWRKELKICSAAAAAAAGHCHQQHHASFCHPQNVFREAYWMLAFPVRKTARVRTKCQWLQKTQMNLALDWWSISPPWWSTWLVEHRAVHSTWLGGALDW